MYPTLWDTEWNHLWVLTLSDKPGLRWEWGGVCTQLQSTLHFHTVLDTIFGLSGWVMILWILWNLTILILFTTTNQWFSSYQNEMISISSFFPEEWTDGKWLARNEWSDFQGEWWVRGRTDVRLQSHINGPFLLVMNVVIDWVDQSHDKGNSDKRPGWLTSASAVLASTK